MHCVTVSSGLLARRASLSSCGRPIRGGPWRAAARSEPDWGTGAIRRVLRRIHDALNSNCGSALGRLSHPKGSTAAVLVEVCAIPGWFLGRDRFPSWDGAACTRFKMDASAGTFGSAVGLKDGNHPPDPTVTHSKKLIYTALLWLIIGIAVWSTQSTLVVSKPVAFVPVPMMCLLLGAFATATLWRGKSQR